MNLSDEGKERVAAVEMKGIVKRFPGVRALSDITLTIKSGTIHGLAGENGSGKSTLLRILAGLERADSGVISVNGQALARVKSAFRDRIVMVTQEPSLVEGLTVAENIALGRRYRNGLLVNWKTYRKIAQSCLERLGANIDLEAKASTVPPDQQQVISIARALAADPQILLLDEVTSSLTEDQTERLFRLLDELKVSGKTIVFISHRLKEYIRLCDRITVLRDGEYICDMEQPGIHEKDVVNAMVGRELTEYFPPQISAGKVEIALKVRDFCCNNTKEISLSINQGEVFVLSGLAGCGRSEVLRGLFGDMPYHGSVEVFGKAISLHSPCDAVRAGFAYIPAERKSEGIIGRLSVQENVIISVRLKKPLWSWLNFYNEREVVQAMVDKFRIKTASLKTAIETLSGGNQQKAILARAIAVKPNILLLDEPTRGVDVGAKTEIYRLLRQIATEGVTVIVSSSDLQEVIGLADRVGVMFRGRLQKVLDVHELTEENVMYYATGNE